jgi:DNA-binding NarL/FixJ family response regulator
MRLLIVDDHALLRQTLASYLTLRGYQIVGEAGSGEEALRLVAQLQPDLVLMDVRMPGMGGLEATRQLVAEHPGVRVVVLSGSSDEEHLFAALQAGAQGYLTKSLDAEEFVELLDLARDGRPVLTPELSSRVLHAFATGSRRIERKAPDALTDRESEVLRLMVGGVTSNADLAHHLSVTENTVKFHVRNILDKLQLHDRAQAVGYAVRSQLGSAAAAPPRRAVSSSTVGARYS